MVVHNVSGEAKNVHVLSILCTNGVSGISGMEWWNGIVISKLNTAKLQTIFNA